MRPLSELVAADVMRRDVVCAHLEQPLDDIERLLVESRIGGAPVVDQGRLVGVVSRSDIVRAQVVMTALDGLAADELAPRESGRDRSSSELASEFGGFRERLSSLRVCDVMTAAAVTCTATTPLVRLAAKMADEEIHRIIVVDGQEPVGIISSLDVVRLVAQLGETA